MTVTVNIEKNIYGGDGLGHLGDGRVIFVPGAFKGDTVKAQIVKEAKGFVKATLVGVDFSPRRDPAQSNVPPQPGMVYASISPEFESELKRDQLAEFFSRARISIPEIETIKTEKSLRYRNKVTYHFSGSKIGYHLPETNDIVEFDEDILACPEINAAWPGIKQNLLTLLTQGAVAVRRSIAEKRTITIRYTPLSGVKWYLGGDSGRGGLQPTPRASADILKETTLGRTFQVPLRGFYQVNPEAGEKLVEAVVREYHRHEELAPNILDLYCGVGVFGLCCTPPKLTGIESGTEAINFAKQNALSTSTPLHGQYKFYAEEVGKNMRKIGIGSQTCVIVDPPRGGLEKGVPEWLRDSKAPRIFYVSCDPATLMRDLRVITQKYEVERVMWVNMFPRTARFETFVTLVKTRT